LGVMDEQFGCARWERTMGERQWGDINRERENEREKERERGRE
jgi:hypothetical protein